MISDTHCICEMLTFYQIWFYKRPPANKPNNLFSHARSFYWHFHQSLFSVKNNWQINFQKNQVLKNKYSDLELNLSKLLFCLFILAVKLESLKHMKQFYFLMKWPNFMVKKCKIMHLRKKFCWISCRSSFFFSLIRHTKDFLLQIFFLRI